MRMTRTLSASLLALALAAFLLLVIWKTPPWIVVALTAAAGVGLALLPPL